MVGEKEEGAVRISVEVVRFEICRVDEVEEWWSCKSSAGSDGGVVWVDASFGWICAWQGSFLLWKLKVAGFSAPP